MDKHFKDLRRSAHDQLDKEFDNYENDRNHEPNDARCRAMHERLLRKTQALQAEKGEILF